MPGVYKQTSIFVLLFLLKGILQTLALIALSNLTKFQYQILQIFIYITIPIALFKVGVEFL